MSGEDERPFIVLIPTPLQPLLRELWTTHEAAKRALAIYVEGMLAGLHLDDAATWLVDTDRMMIVRAEQPAHQRVREVNDGVPH